MILGVIGEGGTKENENRAKEEEKQEDNLGEVAWPSEKAPGAVFWVSLAVLLNIQLKINWSLEWHQQGNKVGSPIPWFSTKTSIKQTEKICLGILEISQWCMATKWTLSQEKPTLKIEKI